MLWRIKLYLISCAFGVSVLVILAENRYGSDISYHTRRIFLEFDDGKDYAYESNPINDDVSQKSIHDIFDKTRSKIRSELWRYNFNYSGINELKDLVMEDGGEPLRSIIVSTWRSGSTFLGDVLNAMPGNFYHYEPFRKYGAVQMRTPAQVDEAISTIKKMLKCDYDNMEGYFEYLKTNMHQSIYNTRLWDHCKYRNDLCLDAEFTAGFCKLFPFQSMKIVTVRLQFIEDLLLDKELNVKVVLLVRDPRGVMQSRQHLTFCQHSPDCWQPEMLCADMVSDYEAAARLLPLYPDRIKVLRYEDFTLNLEDGTQKLLRFLRLAKLPAIDEFLHTHTNAKAGGAYSTFRVSKDVPLKWKNKLDFNYVLKIQTECKAAMKLWGYKEAHNATHMQNEDFNPLENYFIN